MGELYWIELNQDRNTQGLLRLLQEASKLAKRKMKLQVKRWAAMMGQESRDASWKSTSAEVWPRTCTIMVLTMATSRRLQSSSVLRVVKLVVGRWKKHARFLILQFDFCYFSKGFAKSEKREHYMKNNNEKLLTFFSILRCFYCVM
jgi:hypothetical protein